MSVFKSSSSEMVVDINLSNVAIPVEFSAVFDSLIYVPIKIPEQYPEIAEVYKMKVYDDKIGIFDDFNSALHIVDFSGELINVFYVDGSEGYGSIQDMEDFEFLGDTLLLYERSTQRVHKYDLDTKEYFGYLAIDRLFLEFIFYKENFYIYADEDRFGFSDYRSNKLQIFDRNLRDLLFSAIPYVPGRDEFDTPQRFFRGVDRLYFSDLYNDTIYSFKQDDIFAEYAIDWGRYRIPEKLLATNDQQIITNEFFTSAYRGFKHFLFATDFCVGFWYREGTEQNFYFLNKKNGIQYNISSLIDNINGGTLPFPMIYDSEKQLFLSFVAKEQIQYEQKDLNGISSLAVSFDEHHLNYLVFYTFKN